MYHIFMISLFIIIFVINYNAPFKEWKPKSLSKCTQYDNLQFSLWCTFVWEKLPPLKVNQSFLKNVLSAAFD